MRKTLIMAVFSTFLAACSGAAQSDLDQVHLSIETRYSDINHIKADALLSFDGDAYVLFDVRKREEFDVSHLPGAIWVDPSITASDFLGEYSQILSGKVAVFYCSVGERSSRLATRVDAASDKSFRVHNLAKGIFGWHNDERKLSAGQAETDAIHPYDEKWGQLIDRQEKIRVTSK